MPSKLVLFVVSFSTIVLSACGGSSSAPSVMVSDIQANQLKYGQATQFTIAGYSLDKDINISTQNCKSLALVAGGTSSSESVSCTINAVGPGAVTVVAKLADGTVLRSASFDVPNPQVSMVTSMGTMVVELNPTSAPLSTDNFLQ
jgi:hypothetical protein